MSPALLTTGGVVLVEGVRVEPCSSYDEAVTLAGWLRRDGLAAQVATPKRHGTWGVYLAGPEVSP